MAALSLILAACHGAGVSQSPAGRSATAREAEQLQVVATTTVLAYLVEQVGGDRVKVESLVPKGGEVHTFDPSPSDAAKVAEADLIVMNGLGLDQWLAELARDAGASEVPVVELAEGLPGVKYLEGAEHDDDGAEADAHEGEDSNPHLWLNVSYAQNYVDRIVAALKAADAAGATGYDERAGSYRARLTELDRWVREQVATVPAANRKVVSFHEAFPYFADAYGLEIVGVVVDAPGQDPSAGEVAALIDAVRAARVKAIFSEVQFSSDLAERIAQETGATVVADLYNDSLGDPPVDTYEGLIRYDVERIVAALR